MNRDPIRIRRSAQIWSGLQTLLLIAMIACCVSTLPVLAQAADTTLIQDETDGSEQPELDEKSITGDPSPAAGEKESLYTVVGEQPEWVTHAQYIDTETQSEYLVIHSQPRLKQREAEDELEELLVEAVRERVDEMFAEGAGKAIGIDLTYVRENMIQQNEECHDDGIYQQLLSWKVPESNRGMLGSEVRDAYQCFAQIRFDPEFETWASAQWENQLVISRTFQTGLIALSVLLVLGLAFGYFSADHITRGFYSRRLQTMGLGLLLITAAGIWWLSVQISWI